MAEPRPYRLRALHVGPMPPPFGGMATVLMHLRLALEPYCDVEVLSNTKTTPPGRPLIQGVRAQVRLLCRLSSILWRFRPEIVHVHTCSFYMFWRNSLDVLLARSFGSRVVLHIHGARFHEFLGRLDRFRGVLARMILRIPGRVIVLGAVWEGRLRGWCPPQKITVVPNGVFIPAQGRSLNDAAAGHIVCVANYEKRKGLEDLVSALARVRAGRPVRLTLVGAPAEPDYKQHLDELAVELGIRDRVNIPGPARFEEISAYFQTAEIFCLPSHNEGLPMALLEAMAYGLPVLATRVGAIPELIEDGKEGLLYEAGDVAALTACLERLLGDCDCANRIGKAGRERVTQDFGADVMAKRVFQLYRQLWSQNERPDRGGLVA